MQRQGDTTARKGETRSIIYRTNKKKQRREDIAGPTVARVARPAGWKHISVGGCASEKEEKKF